jgi:hypothetical protein
MSELIVVEGLRAVGDLDIDLRSDHGLWSLALDQRCFGPGRLLVAFGDSSGECVGLAHTRRTDPLELALIACFDYFADVAPNAVMAVAYCDEPVDTAGPPLDLQERWDTACRIAHDADIELVDWIACDDTNFRSTWFALGNLER